METKATTTEDLARGGEPQPEAEGRPASADAADDSEAPEALLEPEQADAFGREWADVQAAFVDEPRRAVERADALVAEVMQRLASSFAEERGRLESQWDSGDDVSTEDLRVALTRYRSFFHRLLSA
jgi:hypothetical protein